MTAPPVFASFNHLNEFNQQIDNAASFYRQPNREIAETDFPDILRAANEINATEQELIDFERAVKETASEIKQVTPKEQWKDVWDGILQAMQTVIVKTREEKKERYKNLKQDLDKMGVDTISDIGRFDDYSEHD